MKEYIQELINCISLIHFWTFHSVCSFHCCYCLYFESWKNFREHTVVSIIFWFKPDHLCQYLIYYDEPKCFSSTICHLSVRFIWSTILFCKSRNRTERHKNRRCIVVGKDEWDEPGDWIAYNTPMILWQNR